MPSKYNATEVKMLQRDDSETMNVQFATESLCLELFQEITLRVGMQELFDDLVWAHRSVAAGNRTSCPNKGLKMPF